MDSRYSFSHIKVSCEGYEHKDDPYILRGSCGLQYALSFDASQDSSGSSHNQQQYSTPHHQHYASGMCSEVACMMADSSDQRCTYIR
jgi:hypothetical protein